MASWRDSDDPRCPACGEKITATASYCMHCEADFAADGTVIDETGGPPSAEQDRSESAFDDETMAPSADVSPSDDVDYSAESVTQSSDAEVGEDFEATTLLLRGPIALIMGLPGAVLLTFAAAGVAGQLSSFVGSVVFLLGWFGVTGYLLRKPLASDAIGDGFYVYAAVLLATPLAWLVGDLSRLALGSTDQTLADATVQVVVMELLFIFPAGFLLVLGYGCNYYARSRIEAALNERGRAA